jgi:hypothetical protein
VSSRPPTSSSAMVERGFFEPGVVNALLIKCPSLVSGKYFP